MEKRHIINLQGRDFVTYEGLLDAAHARGLRSVRTTLVQVPTDQNGNVAICQAEVELVEDGETKVFTGIGDANPRNVNRNLAKVETIFMLPDPAHAHVSSSLVRQVASLGGDVSPYVPRVVADFLEQPR